MSQSWFQILLLSLLLLLIVAPFGGLAPLMLVLFIAGVVSLIGAIARVLITGKSLEDDPDSP